ELSSASTSSSGEDQCSQTSASAPSSRTISVRQLTAEPLASSGTSIRTGSVSFTPRGTCTSTPSRQSASLRATKGSSTGTSDPSARSSSSACVSTASASETTVAPSPPPTSTAASAPV